MQIIIVDNDATACFDRMIKAPNNLACLQHGADPKYIQLHAQTQKTLKYHLKHKYGISSAYNTNSNNTPWYGMGQGAGDASNRWVIGTDSMSDAYSEKANGWTLPSPIPHNLPKQTLKAFLDDVNLFIEKTQHHRISFSRPSPRRYQQVAQSPPRHWQRTQSQKVFLG